MCYKKLFNFFTTKSEQTENHALATIPLDVWHIILSYLSSSDRAKLARAHKFLKKTVYTSKLDNIVTIDKVSFQLIPRTIQPRPIQYGELRLALKNDSELARVETILEYFMPIISMLCKLACLSPILIPFALIYLAMHFLSEDIRKSIESQDNNNHLDLLAVGVCIFLLPVSNRGLQMYVNKIEKISAMIQKMDDVSYFKERNKSRNLLFKDYTLMKIDSKINYPSPSISK